MADNLTKVTYDGSVIINTDEDINVTLETENRYMNSNILLQVNHGGISDVEWGQITGDITDQTDLNNALEDKANADEIPTKTSELINDSGYITENDIPTKTSELTNDSGFITEDDIPTIPTKTSELTNDSGFITSSYHDTSKMNIIDYSTNEVNTGVKWIDNKDVYQKIIVVSSLSLSLYTDIEIVDISALNIDKLISINGRYCVNSNEYYNFGANWGPYDNVGISYRTATNNIICYTTVSNRTNLTDIVVIIRYTKNS